MLKKIFMILLAALLLTGAFQTSEAALTAVGPVSPATGYFPVWYADGTRTLELCLSTTPSPDPAAGGAPMCNLIPAPGIFDLALPVVFPLNFPDESFYFGADANIVSGGVDLRYVSAIEAAFSVGDVINGDQIVFARIRFFAQLPTTGTYIITHPFGVDTFVVDTINPIGREIQFTRDIGIGSPGDFTGALNGDIWPFLVRSIVPGGAPAPITILSTGETFLGDPNVTQFVTGSRFGTNYVRIQGPGIDLLTDEFLVNGKVFGGVLPAPLSVDRATYNRTATGSTVEVFATSSPTAALSFRETVAAGVETPMTGDPATGKFFKQYAPAALPANLVVTASQLGAPPTSLGSPVVDVVRITRADYSFATMELTIEANSSDELPLPTLTAVGWGTLSVPVPPAGTLQRLVVPNVTEPPARVTVKSSAGGADTEPVLVPLLNAPPVALNNNYAITPGTTKVLFVLANDYDPNGNLPLTVAPAGLTQPLNGTATISLNQRSLIYTPNPGFLGIDTFTYQAADALGALSNVATVRVIVNDVPIANPDAATTKQGIAVAINVIANDTDTFGGIAAGTVTIVTPPAVGTGTVLVGVPAAGSVTFTPDPAFLGVATFTYTVADRRASVSTPATVTITVNANAAPVAVSNTATTPQGAAVAINVLANDADPDGTINATTVAIVTGPTNGTTSVNPVTGVVTYTPNALFSGPDSFTYTVQDNQGAVSNVATVSVTVTNASPVAANDSATTTMNIAVAINVLANDTDTGGTLNPASVTVVTTPANGTASVDPTTGAVIYTPNLNFTGANSFTYTVQDNLGAVSNAATVSVNVLVPGNFAPVAVNDSATTPAGTPVVISVMANDDDPDNDGLERTSVTVVSPPLNGTAVVNTGNGTIIYTPNAGFTGTNTFTYTVADRLGAVSNAATVTVTVQAAGAERLTALRAEYRTGNSWNIAGTSTVNGATVAIRLGSDLTGPIIGTAAVSGGKWQFKGASAAVPNPGTVRTISVQSTGGGTVLGRALTVR